jgi:hypothetical protein
MKRQSKKQRTIDEISKDIARVSTQAGSSLYYSNLLSDLITELELAMFGKEHEQEAGKTKQCIGCIFQRECLTTKAIAPGSATCLKAKRYSDESNRIIKLGRRALCQDLLFHTKTRTQIDAIFNLQ